MNTKDAQSAPARRVLSVDFVLFVVRITPFTKPGASLQSPAPERAARQARDIPVFRRTGNFNSLFGEKIPCSAA
jgi:hypothetical protein